MAGAAPARPVQEVQRRRRPARLVLEPHAASRPPRVAAGRTAWSSRRRSRGLHRTARRELDVARGSRALRARGGAVPRSSLAATAVTHAPCAAASSTKKCPTPPDAPVRRSCASVERSDNPQEPECREPCSGAAWPHRCSRHCPAARRGDRRELPPFRPIRRRRRGPTTRAPAAGPLPSVQAARTDPATSLPGAPARGFALEQERLAPVEGDRVYGDYRLVGPGRGLCSLDEVNRGELSCATCECLHRHPSPP